MGRKVNISAYIDIEDLEKLEDLSREMDESISSLVRQAIKEFVAKLKPVEGAS